MRTFYVQEAVDHANKTIDGVTVVSAGTPNGSWWVMEAVSHEQWVHSTHETLAGAIQRVKEEETRDAEWRKSKGV